MKILYAMPHPGYLRNEEAVIRVLATRGHRVHVAFGNEAKGAEGHDRDQLLTEALGTEFPSVTFGLAAERSDHWRRLLGTARSCRDCLRYLHPRYDAAPRLRERAAADATRAFTRLASLPLLRSTIGRGFLELVLSAIERALPSSPDVEQYLASIAADVVVVTPLVNVGSTEVEYVKSARRMALPSVLSVASWDNLTNKGLMRIEPDLVVVWNEAQKQEAVELHSVHPNRVLVAGAPRFDEWFRRAPSRSRREFCSRLGLPDERPYLLYVCSSKFVAPDEVTFAREWLTQIRACPDPHVREVAVVVRPHPQNASQWRDVDLSPLGPVSIWPREGENPIDADGKALYFDSLSHSSGVVGINTSALIEAGIVGRTVYSVAFPTFDGTQRGTLHFQHLLTVGGGIVQFAESFSEHLGHLGQGLSGNDTSARLRRFVQSFVRPNGLDAEVAPLVAEAIERLAAMPRTAQSPDPAWVHPVRLALWPLAVAAEWLKGRKATERDRQLVNV